MSSSPLVLATPVNTDTSPSLFGYDQADFGGLLTLTTFRQTFSQLDTVGDDTSRRTALVQGITNASWNAGCIVSAIATIWLGGILGRRKTILAGLSFLIIGEIIQATSYSLGQLITGRVIAGIGAHIILFSIQVSSADESPIGNGFSTAAVPAYQAETTRAHRRGTHLMISGACIAAGAAFAYWIDFAFAYTDPSSASWRVPIAFQLILAVPLLPLVAFLPESPRWLILTGRADESLRVLAALKNVDTEDTHIYKEWVAIKDAVIQASSGGFADVFTQGSTRHMHRTLLACLVQCFQQIGGINLVIQYIAFILFTRFGFEGWSARLIAGCLGIETTIASIIPIVGIDNFWGRRSLLMFGSAGMAASLAIVTAMAYLQGTAGQALGTIFIFVYCTFFVIGWQGMAWLYSVEVVPLKIRGPATALSTSVNWIMNFWVVFVTPIAFHDIGYKTYIIFAVLNAAILPAVYFLFPECAYRTLEEMDVIFHAASLSKTPFTTVVRDSREAPLWYGRDGEKDFDYEDTQWHRSKVRFSDEVTAGSDDGSYGGSYGTKSGSSGDKEKRDVHGDSSDDDVDALPYAPTQSRAEERNDLPAGHPQFYKMGYHTFHKGRTSRSSGRA